MKKLLLGFTFLLNFLAYAADHNQEWPVSETSLVLRTATYDEETVRGFYAVMYKFHQKDMEINAEFKEQFEHRFAERVQSFKNNQSSLLLIYKDATIVGGTYFFTEGDEKVVRLGGTALDDSALNKEENAHAIGAMMKLLSSGTLFPNANKIVFFLPNNSQKIALAKHFGFSESDYPLPEGFPSTHFGAFERVLK